jgi:hypothetical protein
LVIGEAHGHPEVAFRQTPRLDAVTLRQSKLAFEAVELGNVEPVRPFDR